MYSEGLPVNKIIEMFRASLGQFYSGNEIMQFIYTLFAEYLNWPKTRIHLDPEFIVPSEKASYFNEALQDLIEKRPIQYIIGKSWFNEKEYIVNADVLIPRPETEELCNLIFLDNSQDQYKDIAVLDIGTGSGCIAIDLKMKFPYAKILAVDQSPAALRVARQNAEYNSAKVDFMELDILDSGTWGKVSGYDIIVSNPPYILESEKEMMDAKVKKYEPASALYVPDDDPLKFYAAICSFAKKHLNQSGKLYFEINERFGKETVALIKEFGFEKVELLKDFFGKDRFIRAVTRTSIRDLSYWYADKQ